MTCETVRARGHPNVTATHRSTFEVTRDRDIGLAADCIIAVCADRWPAGLSGEFKSVAARDDAKITAEIHCEGHKDTVQGWGSSKMTFTGDRGMVFRVSDFVCGRTVMINADKAARGLDRGLINALASGCDAVIVLTVETASRPEPTFETLFGGQQ
jgi:uncharacterized protein